MTTAAHTIAAIAAIVPAAAGPGDTPERHAIVTAADALEEWAAAMEEGTVQAIFWAMDATVEAAEAARACATA